MRARRTGTIVNLSSVAAKDPQATSALYSASKGAIESLSDGLAKEVAPFNISVLIVEPGAFRTNFLAALNRCEAPLPPDYAGTPADQLMGVYVSQDGKQVGDPQKGVDRIFEAVVGEGVAGHLKGKVTRLVLGRDSLERMRRATGKFLEDLALGEEVATSTAYE